MRHGPACNGASVQPSRPAPPARPESRHDARAGTPHPLVAPVAAAVRGASRREALRTLAAGAGLAVLPAALPTALRAQPIAPPLLQPVVQLAQATAGGAPAPAAAPVVSERGGVELTSASVARTDDGVLLSFAVRVELPRLVEDALLKGVPLFFEAEAHLWRYRWYWRDESVAHIGRTWRLSWQPLTRDWRVGFGGLQQRYATLAEALAAMSRGTRWKLTDPLPASDDSRYYVELAWRLDTSQLSRPLQVGLSGQSEWDLSVRRTLAVPDAGR